MEDLTNFLNNQNFIRALDFFIGILFFVVKDCASKCDINKEEPTVELSPVWNSRASSFSLYQIQLPTLGARYKLPIVTNIPISQKEYILIYSF